MIRLVIAALFLALGLFMFFSEVVGFYKFTYVMNRMHAAAMDDTRLTSDEVFGRVRKSIHGRKAL